MFSKTTLTIAIAKGRILTEALPLLAQVGITPKEESLVSGRKLIVPTSEQNLQLIIVRATDVPTFVAHGAADFGIVGKDVILEQGAKDCYEPLDLNIAHCRLMVACPKTTSPNCYSQAFYNGKLKVATKYVNITHRYFAQSKTQIEVIKLYGSMEIAPFVGLAHCIVDLVDTGKTLAANGLQATELILTSSARLLVNQARLKTKYPLLNPLITRLTTIKGVIS